MEDNIARRKYAIEVMDDLMKANNVMYNTREYAALKTAVSQVAKEKGWYWDNSVEKLAKAAAIAE